MRPSLRVGTVYDFRNTLESGMDMQSLYAAIMDQVVVLDGLGLGIGEFVAVTFASLVIGTFFLGFLSDRYGRRFIFTYSPAMAPLQHHHSLPCFDRASGYGAI